MAFETIGGDSCFCPNMCFGLAGSTLVSSVLVMVSIARATIGVVLTFFSFFFLSG